MRIAVAGKGGVGKTTVSAGLCLLMAQEGRNPWAVDADPNNCLGYALGFPPELMEELKPLSEMRQMLAERAGSEAGAGGMFILAPPVSDIISEYEVNYRGVSLMVMGIVDEGGTGCMCPENATLRAILRELVDEPRDLVVDMVAGLEHLGRGTAQPVDGLLMVTRPTSSALRAVGRIVRLAEDIDLAPVWVLGNGVTSEDEAETIREAFPDLPVVGMLGHYEGLSADDVLAGTAGGKLKADLNNVIERLYQYEQES